MKKLLVLLFLLLGIGIAINAQNHPKSDLYYQQLGGKVKKLNAHIYYVIDSTGKEEMTWVYSETELFNKNGNYIFDKTVEARAYFNDSVYYEYDDRGNLILEAQYEEHNMLENRIAYIYDTSGNVLSQSELEYDIDDDSGNITDSFCTTDVYYYNDLNLVKEVWRSEMQEDGYFSKSRLYIANIYEDSGRVRYQYEYRSAAEPDKADTNYQRKNNRGQIEESYNAQTHSRYEYDSLGRMIKSISLFLNSDRKIGTNIFTYDKWGNKTGTTSYDSAGKIISPVLTSIFYDVDRKGNWRKVKGYKDGKFVYCCKRKIEYY